MCHVNQRTSNKLVGNLTEQTTKIFFPVIHKCPAPTGTSHFMSSQTSVFKRRHAAFWWLSYLNFQTPREYKTLILVWLFFLRTESQDSEFWRDRYIQSGLTQWKCGRESSDWLQMHEQFPICTVLSSFWCLFSQQWARGWPSHCLVCCPHGADCWCQRKPEGSEQDQGLFLFVWDVGPQSLIQGLTTLYSNVLLLISGINSFEMFRNCKTDTWHLPTLLPQNSILFTVSCIPR